MFIDLEDVNDLEDDEREEEEEDDRLRDITPAEFQQSTPGQATLPLSAGVPGERVMQEVTTASGMRIGLNECVELNDGSFLRVKGIVTTGDAASGLRGVRFVRARDVMNMLPMKHNEVCAVLKAPIGAGDDIPDVTAGLVVRPLSDVICTRTLILTNQPFPAHSFRESGVAYSTWPEVNEFAPLVCRYKHVEYCDTMTWKVPSEALVRLRKHECDINIDDAQLLLNFRGPEKLSRTQGAAADKDVAGATSSADSGSSGMATVGSTMGGRSANTYADICAGAGGAAIAARNAGFTVDFALDYNADACATLRLNLAGTTVREEDVFSFCTSEDDKDCAQPDVLHISFPCQPYSKAHTREGRDDAKNVATGYSVIPLLQKCKPRIATFEQSPNITKGKHRPSFRALIHQITYMGYSARWKVVNFAQTGNAHNRSRLFIIASW